MNISVVIVEDDAVWREQLARLYREAFARYAYGAVLQIEALASGPDAIRRIKKAGLRSKIDLLSCDINLLHAHPTKQDGSPDLTVPGVDGFTILRLAAQMNAVVCAIVPTFLLSDQELEVILPGRAESARLTIDRYLRDLFNERQLRLDKTAFATPGQTVDIWIEAYGKRIVDLSNAWPRIRPPYTIANRSSDYSPRIWIWTHQHGRSRGAAEIRNPGDQWLLNLLGEAKRIGELVTYETVYGVYRGKPPDDLARDQIVRVASSEWNSAKRRLIALGIDPDWLVETVRNRGFRLCDDVHLYGFGDASQSAESFSFLVDERPNQEEELIGRREGFTDCPE